MTRTGKIARLPREVREELNRRLLDGETAQRLVIWLNAQAEVRAMLAEYFDGREIRVQSISEWRAGGWGEWCRRRDALELAALMGEEADDFEALANGTRFADRFAQAAAVVLMGQIRAAGAMEEGPEKMRAVFKAVAALIRLRGSERQWERSVREGEGQGRAVGGGANASGQIRPNPSKSDQIRPRAGRPSEGGAPAGRALESGAAEKGSGGCRVDVDIERRRAEVAVPLSATGERRASECERQSYPYPVGFGLLNEALGYGPELGSGRARRPQDGRPTGRGAKAGLACGGRDGPPGETSQPRIPAARPESGACLPSWVEDLVRAA